MTPTAFACPFRSRESFVENGTLDPRRRWVALSAEQVSAAEARSPFAGCSAGAPRYNKTLAIVFAFYVDRARNTSSGLGSLVLQILDASRFAVANGLGVRFPDPGQWTYGAPADAPGPTAWNSVFHEITDPACVAPGAEVQHVCGVSCGTPYPPPWAPPAAQFKTRVPRQEDLLMLDRFRGARAGARNAEILRAAGLERVVGGDNDVQAVQVLFRWVFRLQPWVRAAVDAATAPALAALAGRAFIGVHIRLGDKVGRGSKGAVGKETEFVPLEQYMRAITCFYGAGQDAPQPPKLVFVATDDARAVPQLRALLGTGHDVVTLASASDKGHDENQFNAQGPEAKWREFVTLWASLELLARAELFVGNQESNVFRVAHLMRLGKPANSSVSVHVFGGAHKTCCAGPLPRAPQKVGHTTQCVYDCTA
jgi:hypothetical protein